MKAVVFAGPGQPFAVERVKDAFIKTGDDAMVLERLGARPDLVFECAGVPGAIAQAAMLVRSRGTVVVVGSCFAPDVTVPVVFQMRGIRVQYSTAYDIRDLQDSAEAMNRGSIEPRKMITGTIGLDDVPRVMEELRRHSAHCKVLIDPAVLPSSSSAV